MNIYIKKYSPDIEEQIEEEIETQKAEDQHDERFWDDEKQCLKNSDKEYREWAIDTLIGNNIIQE